MQNYFKDIITSYTEKIRSRSIGYDVIEAIEGERSFLTVYGSKIWDLFPAMSFLKLLNFETNLPNMEFDYSKLEKKKQFFMPTYNILFVGLGKMGFHMAGYLSKIKILNFLYLTEPNC